MGSADSGFVGELYMGIGVIRVKKCLKQLKGVSVGQHSIGKV